MYLLLGSKHHVSKLIQLNRFTFFSLSRTCMEISIFITYFELHSEIVLLGNISAFFKKFFSIDIDRKKQFSVSILSFIAMFILFLTTRYQLHGPENLRSQLKLIFPRTTEHTQYMQHRPRISELYIDPICSAYSS